MLHECHMLTTPYRILGTRASKRAGGRDWIRRAAAGGDRGGWSGALGRYNDNTTSADNGSIQRADNGTISSVH